MFTPVLSPAWACAAPEALCPIRSPRSHLPVLCLPSPPPPQDDTGAVTGAECRLGWEAGGRTALQLSRALSQFGAAHVDTTSEWHCRHAVLFVRQSDGQSGCVGGGGGAAGAGAGRRGGLVGCRVQC